MRHICACFDINITFRYNMKLCKTDDYVHNSISPNRRRDKGTQ